MAAKTRRTARERGAAAVEMAIILPLLLLVIGGIIDLGRMYMGEVVVTNAARDAVRMASYQTYTTAQVQARGVAAAAGLKPFVTSTDPVVTPPAGSVSTSPPLCSITGSETVPSVSITVTAQNFSWMMLNVLPRFFGVTVPAPTIAATASMQCPPT
ncbi:MAG: TadE/TadG family type IV pilus assembly protein, partial [Mycobacteriaceae bacterium]